MLAYRKLNSNLNIYEVTTLDAETEKFYSFNYFIVDGKLCKINEFHSTLSEMGYKCIKGFKTRMKDLNKELFDLDEINLPLFNVNDYSEDQRKEFARLFRERKL